MNLTITGYSTALFSTWYFLEELGILFDAGDGLTASLLQKSRKIENVFLSHADRDHLTGLLQLNQLNARDGYPRLFYPASSSSFPALEEFTKRFDKQVSKTIWQGIRAGEHIEVRKNTYVQAVRNNHVKASQAESRSLGYQVYQTKDKLKPEFLSLPQADIVQRMNELGRAQMMSQVRTNLVAYSGDTPVENFDIWNNTQILIHEATFLKLEEQDTLDPRRNKHSTLEAVLKMVAEIQIETLILGHFSSRYSHEQIDETIKSLCTKFNIKIPVFRVLPGQTHWNILGERPINRA